MQEIMLNATINWSSSILANPLKKWSWNTQEELTSSKDCWRQNRRCV